ncbi:MAG: alpha/beta-type small acid-soluble spore protein [bacterium]|nr:alpha/beta-type small acid-soluble spore protein [bacterium]
MYNNQNQNQNQAQNKNNQGMVPEARQALDNMKYEIASELGINLKQGYNGDLPSRQAGSIGGYMVKRLIEQAERQMAGK